MRVILLVCVGYVVISTTQKVMRCLNVLEMFNDQETFLLKIQSYAKGNVYLFTFKIAVNTLLIVADGSFD
jgi:hypothetical protein